MNDSLLIRYHGYKERSKIQDFAYTSLGKVAKFQGIGMFCSGVLNHLLGWRWKIPFPFSEAIANVDKATMFTALFTTLIIDSVCQ